MTPTDQLIEAMARAIYDEERSHAEPDDVAPWPPVNAGEQLLYRRLGAAALRAAYAELDRLGWAVVPKEATAEMAADIDAQANSYLTIGGYSNDAEAEFQSDGVKRIHAALCAAAPKPPGAE